MLVKSSTVPHECVEPKCTELNRVRTALHDKITKRLETLHKWRELMEQVERVNQFEFLLHDYYLLIFYNFINKTFYLIRQISGVRKV